MEDNMSDNIIIGNRQYKDRLFIFLFGKEERKEWTLELYNAINGTDYTDASAIEINTLDNVLFMGMRNDVSFIIDGNLSLFEHQSTFNPNMPLRMLEYLVDLLRRYCEEKNYNYYMASGIPLPNPRFVVFSNWEGDNQDERTLRLSDMFMNPQEEVSIELYVRVLNINHGYNKHIMQRCRPLLDYSIFVDTIRECRGRGMDLGSAIDRAIDGLPDDSMIRGLLQSNRTEVKGMLETENDAKKVLDMVYYNGKVEGKAEGKAEGHKDVAKLYSILINEKRHDDFEKALSNEEYMNQLLEQYNLI